MNYTIYIVSLLIALERYLPYMSDEELERILDDGERPDALTISLWEYRKFCRDEYLERQFKGAFSRQEPQKNRKAFSGDGGNR